MDERRLHEQQAYPAPRPRHQEEAPPRSKAPRKKVIAGTGGALGGGEIARLVIFFSPTLPPDVALTVAVLSITITSFLSAYFTPSE